MAYWAIGGSEWASAIREMTGKPNVLFIFCDQQRPDTMGCCGQRLPDTPNLDALAARREVE